MPKRKHDFAEFTITCSHCQGRGYTKLRRSEREVLEVVAPSGGVTTAELAKALGIGHSAACNRVRKLMLLGFVTSSGDGDRYNPHVWTLGKAAQHA